MADERGNNIRAGVRHDAMMWEPLDEGTVQCLLCRHACVIKDGKRGICSVRENRGGKLYTLVYDRVIAKHVDPIEKKPLFHFQPGSFSFSIATPGCNFTCRHCQNADISQMPRDARFIAGESFSPDVLVDAAIRSKCKSISYTYTEPTIFFELAYDTAKLASEAGLKNVFVTNGYIAKGALEKIAPYLHGANIDLKSFSDDFYKKVCGARLQSVLDSIRLHYDMGIWIEITTLIIPNHNDSSDELRKIAGFIASIDRAIPWHVTQFHPVYKMLHEPRTPVETLRAARRIGSDEGLKYVYEGNVPGSGGESTYCTNCKKSVIIRYGYIISEYNIKDGACKYCGTPVNGVDI